MILRAATLYTQLLYGKTSSRFGAVLLTAPTGGAAFNIKGFTWHSALGKHFQSKSSLSEIEIQRLGVDIPGIKLYVLDEISLVRASDLDDISSRLSAGTQVKKPFGGKHTILAGDFYQIKTTGDGIIDINLDKSKRSAIRGQEIFTSMTHCVLLKTNERAKGNVSAMKLASFLEHARTGEVSHDDVALINTRVVKSLDDAIKKTDPRAIYITSTHAKIADINKHFQKVMVANGSTLIRLIAQHKPARMGVLNADDLSPPERRLLYSVSG